jgi:hypothetical protein
LPTPPTTLAELLGRGTQQAANARVKGLWKGMPLFFNVVAAMSWQ